MRDVLHLTLCRREWEEALTALVESPRVSESYHPALHVLLASLSASDCEPWMMVTIGQAALTWTPILVGLGRTVLGRPDLLSVAERLRDQMIARATFFDCPCPSVFLGSARRSPDVQQDVQARVIAQN